MLQGEKEEYSLQIRNQESGRVKFGGKSAILRAPFEFLFDPTPRQVPVNSRSSVTAELQRLREESYSYFDTRLSDLESLEYFSKHNVTVNDLIYGRQKTLASEM
jgi:hypothetical protein